MADHQSVQTGIDNEKQCWRCERRNKRLVEQLCDGTPMKEAELKQRLLVWVTIWDLIEDLNYTDAELCELANDIVRSGMCRACVNKVYVHEAVPGFTTNCLAWGDDAWGGHSFEHVEKSMQDVIHRRHTLFCLKRTVVCCCQTICATPLNMITAGCGFVLCCEPVVHICCLRRWCKINHHMSIIYSERTADDATQNKRAAAAPPLQYIESKINSVSSD
mmetsp:Transcript_3487/g.4163  ORF Transcript_3487/g.4163 Transcript_3487/m.4163 type:complete len:218 (+) Transcript_3487:257-910(+)